MTTSIQFAPFSCPTHAEGDLRLVGTVTINGFVTGAVQVFLNGAFGGVCKTGFGPTGAAVACRQLGYVDGIDVQSPFGRFTFGLDPLRDATIQVLRPTLADDSFRFC